MVNVDSKLLEALQQSTCFGIAYDETVPECKQCDVKAQCKAKSEGAAVPMPIKNSKPKADTTTVDSKESKPKKPSSKKETKPPKNTKPKETTKTNSNPVNPGDMPDFKGMQLEELKALAKDRSVDWKDYGNDNITRMRLIMNLKKSYQ